MIDKFSSQYYIGEVYLEQSRNTEQATMNQTDFDRITDEIYGQAIIEPPILMKVENKYIPIKPSDTVASQVAEIPDKTLKELSITRIPKLQQVLFPTQSAVEDLNRYGFLP